MKGKDQQVEAFARMWPREVFDCLDTSGHRQQPLVESLTIFDSPGVYVLYREDVPYYVGQAGRLRRRIRSHATNPSSRYYNFWNFFSAFVVKDRNARNEIEGILIASMPTANGSKPKLKRERLPKPVRQMIRQMRHHRANQHRESPEK